MSGLLIFIFCFALFTTPAQAQPRVILQPYHIDNIPALHSGVCCPWDGKWLLIGGRTNGLHAFQGSSIFGELTQNHSIVAVDPVSKKLWSVSTSSLPESIREHICSSNMQWIVRDTVLYIIGGYGYSESNDDFYTWPRISAVRIDSLLHAVQNGTPINNLFRQTEDQHAAVCGAHAQLLPDSGLSIVFGHRFDGTYNKDSIGNFVQHYSCAIQNFKLDVENLGLHADTTVVDSVLFHRRDYNLVPHVDGQHMFAVAYSGVFRPSTHSPFTSAIEIHGNSAFEVPNFKQQFSNYECAVVPAWDPTSDQQYDYMIGGMAEYYYDANHQLVHDTLVPFVNTISCVTRSTDGRFVERAMDTTFGLMGSDSYFIANDSLCIPHSNGVIQLQANALNDVGYIYGGILSPRANISAVNPALSMASNEVYKVYIDTRVDAVALPVADSLSISCYQCTQDGNICIRIFALQSGSATVQLFSTNGSSSSQLQQLSIHAGWNSFVQSTPSCASGMYFLRYDDGQHQRSCKLVLLK